LPTAEGVLFRHWPWMRVRHTETPTN